MPGPKQGGKPAGGPGPGPGRNFGGVKPKNTSATLKRILAYMGRNKFLLIFVFLMLIASTVCATGASYWLKPILNDVADSIKANNFATVGVKQLTKNLAIVSLFYIGAAICTYLQSRIMLKLAFSTTNTIRKDLFDKLQTLPLRFFDSKSHGEIMSRFTNDVDNIQVMLEQTIVQFVSAIFTFIGIVCMMLFLQWKLFLIALFFLGVTALNSIRISKKVRKYFKNQQEALGEMDGNIEEVMEGMKIVKVFNYEKDANETFENLNSKYRDAATNAAYYAGLMGPTSTGITNTSYATVTIVGALLVITSGLDIGTFFTFLTYTKQFSQPINQIMNQMNNIFSALAGAERVFEVMDEEPEVDEGTVYLEEIIENGNKKWFWVDGENKIELRGDIKFNNVTFSYVPDKVVLNDINLYAKPEQKIAFVGSTGAGKTTITNLINRFYDIQEGTITYDGIDVKRIKKSDLRHSLAMVLQDTHLFTGTIMENIRYGRLDATDEECIAASKLASAHSFIKHLPDGYNTEITGDGSSISQGQRQLLSIARAAVANPPVMVLDEATSSVDTRTERHIEHGMDRLMLGRTVLVIAHRLSTVRNSNAIMVLENGEIIEKGNHDQLIELKGRYYELYTGKAQLT